jgi:hypothetical protein
MGKFAKITLALGIIVIVASGGLMAFSMLTQSKQIWSATGSTISSNNSVTLKAQLYIFGIDYTFNYVEELTMSIDVIISNTATSEEHILHLSVSPSSSYVETKYDAETIEAAGGIYNISYSCLSAEFKGSATRFRVIKPGLFRDTTNPEGRVTAVNDQEHIWDLVGQYSFAGIALGVLILILAFFIHIGTRHKKPDTATNKTYYQNDSSFQQEGTYHDTQFTTQTNYQTPPPPPENDQQNFWTCKYCNSVNDNLTGFCIICNMKKE